MKNIAFSGKMCSGKTTLAAHLTGKYSYVKVSFADGVYKVAREIFGMKEKDRELLQRVGMKMREVDSNVWIYLLKKKAKESLSIPYYEIGKLDPIGYLENLQNFTCDDCRFINEVMALQDWGWLVIRLDCPEQQRMERIQKLYPDTSLEALHHISETELDTYAYFDYGLDAGKPLNEVISELDTIVQRYGYGGERNEKVCNLS